MTNKIYLDHLINNIGHAIRQAKNAAEINHPGLVGRIRELAVSYVFNPMLPSGVEIGTGKICDRDGGLSNEIDLIIYNRSILPPVMYSPREGLFPIEACFYAIEVKSKATASEIQDAIQKGKEILKLNYPKPADEPKNLRIVLPTFFAFSSDLSDPGLSELQRYAKYDSDWEVDPIIRVICVVGKGYWYYNRNNKCWFFHHPTPAHDEVIGLMSGVVDTLAEAQTQKRLASLSKYLMPEHSLNPVRK